MRGTSFIIRKSSSLHVALAIRYNNIFGSKASRRASTTQFRSTCNRPTWALIIK